MTNPITLVTGASRGIGRATALACAKAGHTVAVNYQANEAAAQAVVDEITGLGGTAIAIPADLGSEADILRLFETVDRDLGTLTNLVNNAGIHGPRGRLDALTDEDIARVLMVNVKGCFLCAREAVKRMSTRHGGQGGAIVNISSGAAHLGSPGGGVLYSASKGAVNSLTIGLAQEVAGEGIRVNTVSPGLTETDMPGADKLAQLGPKLPSGRPGQPAEIAAAVLFLLSDEAGYVSGANLRVSGGKP